MKLETKDERTRPVIFEYGLPGTGKSRVIGTWPGKVLLIQTESGKVTSREIKPDILVARVESWGDLDPLRKGIDKFLMQHKITDDFDLIALDSLTEAAEFCKLAVIKEYPPKNHEGIPELQSWMMILERMRQILWALRYSGKAVYLTAQAIVKDMGPTNDQQSLWLPSLPGELRTKIGNMVDISLYSIRNGDKFEVVTEPTAVSMGKMRGIKAGRRITNDLNELYKLWESSFGD